jgi:hypothetical protein
MPGKHLHENDLWEERILLLRECQTNTSVAQWMPRHLDEEHNLSKEAVDEGLVTEQNVLCCRRACQARNRHARWHNFCYPIC